MPDKKTLDARRGQLELERSSFITHWRELNEYISPRSARFLVTDRNKGDKRNQKIINNTATLAARSQRSGMMGGITSPSRPWFVMATPDPDLNKFAPVKTWLYQVTKTIRDTFSRSNVYNCLPIMYHDLGVYGTHAMGITEDSEDVIRCYPFPIGSYMLANSSRLNVDTCYREYGMTVRQLINTFGEDKVSHAVKSMAKSGNLEAWIDIVHVVQPNENFDGSKLDSKFKKFASIYYEKACQQDMFLSESGFDKFRIIAPRWDVTGEDVYATNCPGMEALGDIKGLQKLEMRSYEAIDKHVRPPMNAPSSMRTKRASILPGDINYVDVNQGQQGFTPAYQVQPQTESAEMKIAKVEQRIKRAFFEDLFLMVSSYEGQQPRTAEEIAALKGEQLLMLGPVLERLNDEALSPLVANTYDILEKRGDLPPVPEEVSKLGQLNVEYVSIIAQAQKLTGAASIERFASFTGNLAGVFPEARYRLNVDGMIDEYAEATGAPPTIIVPVDEANKLRQADAQKQQAAEAMQIGLAGAQGAELLSKTDTQSDNGLTRILQGMTGGVPA